MKSLKTTHNLFDVTVLVMLLCGSVWAQTPGPSFFEDFSDQNPTDGVPVNWLSSWGVDATGYVMTHEGLELGGATASTPDGSPYIYSDVSITVQIKRISDHTNNQWVSGFTCRWTEGTTGGYWIEVRPPNRFLFGHRDRYILSSATLPFNVDEKDLGILMDHWQEDINDATLMACWKLDETEGAVAYDSAAENDAVVMGNTLWHPDDGHVDGTLLCDGIDDYVATGFVLNPADGPFSVFAWIQGDIPGQVILSQAEGMDWLMVDAEQGTLKTGLTQSTKDIRGNITPGPSLTSSAIITDGAWHRVGLVRDGAERILYVDGAEVVRDTIEYLAPCTGPLYIGAGCALEADRFWSGMIDDVRIYDRAVEP